MAGIEDTTIGSLERDRANFLAVNCKSKEVTDRNLTEQMSVASQIESNFSDLLLSTQSIRGYQPTSTPLAER